MFCRPIFPSLLISIFLMPCVIDPAVAAAQSLPAPRIVDLSASDGTNLKATYFAASKPGPGVLLLHQCNRQRKVWDDLARRLSASGLNVLTLDFRGYGESGGTPIDKASPEEITTLFQRFPGDVDTAFAYLAAQPGVTRDVIAAGGASCGVNQAVQLARRHPEVKSLALLSETTDTDGRAFLRKSAQIPLFVAVADDDPDPGVVELMQWLVSLSPNPGSKFVRYPKGGHGVEMFAAHPELPGMIVDWLDANLKPKPITAAAHHSAAPASPESRFLDLFDEPGGPANAAQMYADARKHDPKTVLFSEAVINRLGYEHLQSGDTKGAVEILKLNVTAYPHSANAYDSLGDAYLADGQKDLARQSAKKALELLPSDTTDAEDRRKGIKENAERKLKQLGNTPE
jgi:dienelactone hydrolase